MADKEPGTGAKDAAMGTGGLFNFVTPEFDDPWQGEVTDAGFRIDLPLLMLWLDRHKPTSKSFKNKVDSNGYLLEKYKKIIRKYEIKVYNISTLKLWMVHIFIYGNIINFIGNHYRDWSYFEKQSLIFSILSPILGFVGYFDELLFFVCLPMVVMAILFQFLFKNKIYKSYFTAVMFCYGFQYLYMLYNDRHTYPIELHDVDKLAFIVPSLFFALIINWIAFVKFAKSKA